MRQYATTLISYLMTSIVADWADINIESWTHHLVVRILEDVGGVDGFWLIVVLEIIWVQFRMKNYFIHGGIVTCVRCVSQGE